MNIKEFIKRNMPVFIIGTLTLVVFIAIIVSAQRKPLVTKPTLIEIDKDYEKTGQKSNS